MKELRAGDKTLKHKVLLKERTEGVLGEFLDSWCAPACRKHPMFTRLNEREGRRDYRHRLEETSATRPKAG